MTTYERQYELVLLGATGYTGRVTAEHITTNSPTDLRWALAGRSASRLSGLAQTIRSLNPDRLQPGICHHLSLQASKVDMSQASKLQSLSRVTWMSWPKRRKSSLPRWVHMLYTVRLSLRHAPRMVPITLTCKLIAVI